MAEVVRAAGALLPRARIFVKSMAPADIFHIDGRDGPRIFATAIDPGVVEDGLFKIDWPSSIERLVRFLDERAEIVAAETAWIREHAVDLVVADIPFLAGEIAYAAGIPCIGISNFLWDWVYEPMLAGDARAADLLWTVHDAYARFHSILRLPFAHAMTCARIVDVPLLGSTSARAPQDVLAKIGLSVDDRRARVLVSLRGSAAQTAVERIASQERETMFLIVGETLPSNPDNVIALRSADLAFPDVLSIVDVVVAKPGYGVVSSCVVNRKRLLCVPRLGFREDAMLLSGAAQQTPIAPLPLAEFEAGDWGQRLRDFLQAEVPDLQIDRSGASVCANYIARQLPST
jgi:hypothetical protein